MKYDTKNENLMLNKVLFMLFTIIVYIVGKNLPLYMIDETAYVGVAVSTEDILLHTIRGDRYQYSIFALGVSPYMISNIVTQMLLAFKNSESRAKISPKKKNRYTVLLTLGLSVLMAVMQVPELKFIALEQGFFAVRFIAVVEMIAGAILILWLSSRNKKFGIGGQSVLICINLFDSLIGNLRGHNPNQMVISLILTVTAMIVMAVFENIEKKIPLQRVSIHNIYADKNYLAIKMNPVGVMPAMFSMALFMMIQLLVNLGGAFFENNPTYGIIKEGMVLTKPLGVAVYVVGIYFLSVLFARVFLNPKETMEQLLKSGDSIQNVHAGNDTKRYLSKNITGMALLSATMMSFFLALPLILQMYGHLEGTLAALSSSAMMLVGIICNLSREFMAIRHIEGYKPFI